MWGVCWPVCCCGGGEVAGEWGVVVRNTARKGGKRAAEGKQEVAEVEVGVAEEVGGRSAPVAIVGTRHAA